MSTLIRNDGAVFLIQVYRDQLKQQKPSRMRDVVRHLSAKQGRYVSILLEKGVTDIALDKNVGFLLGESVARHFSEQKNFIFIELLEKLNKSLVVVVRDGKVLLDTLVATSSIWPELLPLVADETKYSLYYSGFGESLPLEFPNNGSTAASTVEVLAQATRLPTSLLEALPLSEDLQLVPCEKAIQQSPISGMSKKLWVGTGVFAVFVLAVVLVVGSSKNSQLPKAGWKTPYSDYYRGVSQEPASEVVSSVIHVLSKLSLLPAIQLHHIEYHGHKMELGFVGHNARLTPLLSWAKENHFHFSLHSSSALLTQQLRFKPVNLHNKIYSVTAVYVYLSDFLRSIHPGSKFRLSKHHSTKNWTVLSCEWQVSGLSAADLSWLRSVLSQAPVSCERISLAYREGVMQGTIRLKIWGNA
jgi:hypothetical protein